MSHIVGSTGLGDAGVYAAAASLPSSKTLYLTDPNGPVNVSTTYLSREREKNEVTTSNETTSGHTHGHGPGTQPDNVYDTTMAWWRSGIRRFLVRNLKTESRWIAAMQKRIRTPWLDAYFVYTSTLGTHAFFMTILPALFFFGYPLRGRAIVNVLAFGVYISSLVKDLICSPRPYAPPVTRLTMGSHHLEYGFPSSHSTNSASITFLLYTIVREFRPSPNDTSAYLLSPLVYHTSCVMLIFYMFSIVFGRLYCAMHSFTDCLMGVILGTGIWAVQWVYGDLFQEWLRTPGWAVPLVMIPLCLLAVHRHAEPVDDCPCFEDAIAFVSVILGVSLGAWHGANWGLDEESGYFQSLTPGWQGRDLTEWTLWLTFASLKMVVGVFIIFTWRILAKWTLHATLPPLFRSLSRLFTLPRRRFYTPATDYDGSVPEGDGGLHPIPSVIDIPGMMHSEGGASTALPRYVLGYAHEGNVSMRNGTKTGNGSGLGNGEKTATVTFVQDADDEPEEVKHYDADVLTKVVVYAGIGWLASEFIPVLFEMLEWGVRPARGSVI